MEQLPLVFLNIKTLKMIQYTYVYVVIRIIKRNIDEQLKKPLLIHSYFLKMILGRL